MKTTRAVTAIVSPPGNDDGAQDGERTSGTLTGSLRWDPFSDTRATELAASTCTDIGQSTMR